MTGPTQGVSAHPRVIAGRYTLLAELGRGGMGVVWRAQDNVIGRQVAIKELHLPDGIAVEERRVLEERVLREARTAGRLNDPGVVTVYDVVAENGTNFIVMELVEAATLSTLISAHGPMPQDRVVSMAIQALSALDSAHQAGIVHRDVKPGNLMITPHGRVKLTDFGIAQAVDDPRLTTSGSLIGSPAYMSPERIHGNEASPASDLWALGATLCYAVEGANPYERSTTASTLHAIMNEMPRLTRAHGVLGAVITGLMMPDPNARLTGPQARAMLERAVAQPTPPTGFGAPPHNPTMHYTPPTAVRKPWLKGLLVTGTAVAAVALLIAGVFLGRWWFTDQPPAAMAETITYGPGGTIEASQFKAGNEQCGDNLVDPNTTVNYTDCDEPHRVEVYAAAEPFGSAKMAYPGAEWLRGYAEDFCTLYFMSDRVPVKDKQAKFRYVAIVPTAGIWQDDPSSASSSDKRFRDVACVLWNKDGTALSDQVYAK